MLINQTLPYEAVLDWFFTGSKFVNNNNICYCDYCLDCRNSHNVPLNVNNNSNVSRKRRGRQTTFHYLGAHHCQVFGLDLPTVDRAEHHVSPSSPQSLFRTHNQLALPGCQSKAGTERMGSGASSSKSPTVITQKVQEDRSSTERAQSDAQRPTMPDRNEQILSHSLPLAGGAQLGLHDVAVDQSVNNNAACQNQSKKDNSTNTPVTYGISGSKYPSSTASSAGVSGCMCTPPSPRKKPTKPPSYETYSTLKTIFNEEGREVDYVQGDGNCFFRALSKEIYGSEDSHYELRQTVVDLMAQHRSEFEQFTDTSCKETFAAHLDEMRQYAVWATTAEIYAASTLLQRDIYVFSPDHTGNHYTWLLFSPCFPRTTEIPTSCPQCYITLCHTNGNHYDRVAPLDGSCNCSKPPPVLCGDIKSLKELKEDSDTSLYSLNKSLDENRSDRTKRPGE